MLPKSFSVDKNNLPSVEEPITMAPITYIRLKEPVITNVSLINFIRNYEYDYKRTFSSTLNTLVQLNITPVDYDSGRGQIRARLSSGKELFIFLLPSQEKLTHVRITPADGRYNVPPEMINELFQGIGKNLILL
ncbi:MAG: hypothetical protein A2Y25_09020 [Candidatus Melainabacteria bacterium GWF2_37_15]|nr:MAG: hypothetical protein A2Y25_09020 [Candidatus Melainabacteria bacterium GWF2_37_15]